MEQVPPNPIGTTKVCLALLAEQASNQRTTIERDRHENQLNKRMMWTRLAKGTIKVNCDAAWDEPTKIGEYESSFEIRRVES